MRSYLILKQKAVQFREDREIQALLAEIRAMSASDPIGAYTASRASAIKERAFDRRALAARPLPYERLDQMVIDLLLGVNR
jgi:xylose isomerase